MRISSILSHWRLVIYILAFATALIAAIYSPPPVTADPARCEEMGCVEWLAASQHLTNSQRAWAYTEAARLLMDSERERGLELLDDAANQARRIDPEDPNRARLLIGVTIRTLTVDSVRGWEIMEEAVKAANNSEKFSGENVELHFPFATKSGLKIVSIGGADYGLTGVLGSLAKHDLYRSIDVAKGFKNDGPRAMAVLAIASSLLQKPGAH